MYKKKKKKKKGEKQNICLFGIKSFDVVSVGEIFTRGNFVLVHVAILLRSKYQSEFERSNLRSERMKFVICTMLDKNSENSRFYGNHAGFNKQKEYTYFRGTFSVTKIITEK